MGREYEAELRSVLEKIGTEDSRPIDSSVDLTGTASKGKAGTETSPPRPLSARNLFVHHDTHPLVLDIKLMDQYETDWFEWEPETLWREIMDDFRTPSISDHVKSKIQAVKTIHISDWCFNKWETFCVITQALNNNIPDFEVMRKPTLSQLFATVDMMTMIRSDIPFGADLQQWCAATFITDGVIYAPRPLVFCQDEIVQFMEDSGTPVDPEPVKEKYRSVIGEELSQVVLEENQVDIQVAKLLVANDYTQLRRDQMKHQLRVLR